MTFTTLKEEARDKFWSEFGADYIHHVEVDEFLDSIIDRTYHATKEDVRGMMNLKLEKITCQQCDDEALKDILSALEDTTTNPSN